MDAHKGGDLYDMAKDGTTMPNDAGVMNLIPSKPRPDQIASNDEQGGVDLAGAASNATDMPRGNIDSGATGEVVTGTGDSLGGQVENKRLHYSANNPLAKGHDRYDKHTRQNASDLDRYAKDGAEVDDVPGDENIGGTRGRDQMGFVHRPTYYPDTHGCTIMPTDFQIATMEEDQLPSISEWIASLPPSLEEVSFGFLDGIRHHASSQTIDPSSLHQIFDKAAPASQDSHIVLPDPSLDAASRPTPPGASHKSRVNQQAENCFPGATSAAPVAKPKQHLQPKHCESQPRGTMPREEKLTELVDMEDSHLCQAVDSVAADDISQCDTREFTLPSPEVLEQVARDIEEEDRMRAEIEQELLARLKSKGATGIKPHCKTVVVEEPEVLGGDTASEQASISPRRSLRTDSPQTYNQSALSRLSAGYSAKIAGPPKKKKMTTYLDRPPKDPSPPASETVSPASTPAKKGRGRPRGRARKGVAVPSTRSTRSQRSDSAEEEKPTAKTAGTGRPRGRPPKRGRKS